MKKLSLIVLALWVVVQSFAQAGSSYIYLEGIRNIPFKLKVNNKEIALRHKMYYLVPIQESGEYVMDIVFAGDLYPSQRFILDANNNSAFGYKLAKTVEDKFYLVDLVNKGRIIETNSNVNIGLSTLDNTIRFSNTLVIQDPKIAAKESKRKKKSETNTASVPEESNPIPTEPIKETKAAKKIKREKQKENIEPPQEKKKEPVYGVVEEISAKPKKEKAKEVTPEVSRKLLVNSCVNQSSDQEVKSCADRMQVKSKDEDRMLVLRKKVFTGCISCAQLRTIVSTLSSQFDRLTAIKFLRSSISDMENLTQLEDLFKNESGKAKLRNLMYE